MIKILQKNLVKCLERVYNKIVTYAIETAGHFDIDSEIKLTLTGGIEIEMQFLRGKNMDQLLRKVFNIINEYVTL